MDETRGLHRVKRGKVLSFLSEHIKWAISEPEESFHGNCDNGSGNIADLQDSRDHMTTAQQTGVQEDQYSQGQAHG